MGSPVQCFAVLTGDLVESSRLSSSDSRSVMQRLISSASDFELSHPSSIHGHIDTFRHDSWQLLLQDPTISLRAAIYLRCTLKSLPSPQDTRVFVGVGGVEEIVADRISDSRGDAFSYSGKGLDGLGRGRLGFASPLPRFVDSAALSDAVVPLLDEFVGDWTAAQSRAVQGALMDWTQEEIANRWSEGEERISQSAISKHLRAAHWRAFSRALEWAERELRTALKGS